ncbi:MAG TPA: lipopolysaccharide biosynthesis protein [Thermoanaerobaculia bacterium]|nr:lipopolysaccharide biosynthesis protein [Thermoanaerobaculia bacterium]
MIQDPKGPADEKAPSAPFSLTGIARSIGQHGFLRSVGVLVGGTVVGQGAILAASPLITRLYTPADYGTLAAFTALLFMLLPVSALRYELAVPLVETEEDAAGVVVLALGVVLGLVAATVLLVWLLRGEVARWTEAPALAPLLWLLPVALALGGAYHVLSHWAIRRRDFTVISRCEMTRPLTKVVTQLGLGLLKAGPAGLVLAEITGRVGGIAPLTRGALPWLRARLPLVERRSIAALARQHWRFPVLTGGGTLLGAAASHLPALLIAGLFGLQAAGWLALALRLIAMPITFLGNSIGKVYLSRAGPLAGRDGRSLRRLYLRTGLLLLSCGAIPALALLVAGPPLFGAVFGDAWREAGLYARLLAPMFLGQFVMAPLSNTLDLLGRQRTTLLWHAARLTVVVAAFLVSKRLDLGAATAIGAYGVGTACLYLLLFLLTLRGVGTSAGALSIAPRAPAIDPAPTDRE